MGDKEANAALIKFLSIVAIVVLQLGCRRDSYELIQRSEKAIPNFTGPGTHTEMEYVLSHDGQQFYASCDTERFHHLDPENTCRLLMLRSYQCTLGKDGLNGDPWDLKCRDFEGRNVYLYVIKKE